MRRPAPRKEPRKPWPLPIAAGVLMWLGFTGSAVAQTSASNPPDNAARSMAQVLIWCAVLLGAALLLGIAFALIRKRLASIDEDTSGTVNPMGFTLVDLRQMHEAGQISDEEFDFAKRKMMARTKAQLDAGDADNGDEPEIEDLGDLTEATRTAEAPGASDSPDKDALTQGPPDDRPADKNDPPDGDPPQKDGPPPPPKPPKHW